MIPFFTKEELIQIRINSVLPYERLDPILGFSDGTYKALENEWIEQTLDHYWSIRETRLLDEFGKPIFL